MPDGIRLAVTWWRPTATRPGETFPVLLEYLPYRKDDSFYQRDFPLYDYFARRGFIMAKVDIRGSGASEGHLPPREYSDEELADADEIIRQLAAAPGSNGRVGMWGISWGGFNSLQVAMRHPPALKAIIALHASDDLFHDDVRYIDGILHMDPYTLEIDHENGLPSTATYALDSAYFRNRFEAYPWVLTYLKQPVDGPFWRRHALLWNYGALQVPTYLIGGLLDGYRDTPIRALERATAPVKVEIGPWNHAWPDNGTPGPTYEWRGRAVRWWNQWLRD
ncbi:MAG: CocE/NonD family hydrolase, partial [Gemmatimonadales bacterium]